MHRLVSTYAFYILSYESGGACPSISTWFLLSNLNIQFCIHMYIRSEWFGIVNGQNLLTFQRVAALAYGQKVVSAKYL